MTQTQPRPARPSPVFRLTIGGADPHFSLGRFPLWWLVLFAADSMRLRFPPGTEPEPGAERAAASLELSWMTELDQARARLDRRMARIQTGVADRWRLTVDDLDLSAGWWDQLVFLRSAIPHDQADWPEAEPVVAEYGAAHWDEIADWADLHREFTAALDRADADILRLVAVWVRAREVSPLSIGPEWIGQATPWTRPPARELARRPNRRSPRPV